MHKQTRESSDNQNNAKQLWGEPHQNASQPNDTLRITRATQWWPETNTEHSLEEPPPEATKGDPGKNLHQNARSKQYGPPERTLQPTERQKQCKPVLGEPPPEPPRHRSGKTRQNAPAKAIAETSAKQS
ncbi:hypothetical protein Taro_006950 [Colocasia esculenta]|uniref:Uncharacterized protein n=1 Tax=Colocasia esculenta TaxID=4460 RepID=A0A843TWT4_COLES|nr:hypothetical protein [Colocasia esculenta]